MSRGAYVVLLMAALAVGYFFRVVSERPVDHTPATERHQQRAARAQARVDSLLLVVARRDTADALLRRLHLSEAARLDSLQARHEPLYRRINHANADALHRIADSLLTGHLINRERYRVLLGTRVPSVP